MAGQKHFLRTPYGAYHNPPTPEEDTELTHVERGSACGEYLRRFWQPVAIASEVGELPLKVRMFGEDLVLFRSRAGEWGLLDLHCSHRGNLARIRRRRAPRPPLLLPQLAVRAGRPDPRDPRRAAVVDAQGPALSRRLPGRGA